VNQLKLSRRWRVFAALAALLPVLLAAGCGDKSSVGSGVKVGKSGGGGAALRDAASTTTLPPTTVTTRAVTTTRRAAPTTVTTAAEVAEIKIQDDEQGDPFVPRLLQVPRGRSIKFTYVGTKQPRQVQAKEGGAFRSPPIPPGGSWTWKPAAAGTYDYIDTTRPYSFGEIQVY